METDEGVEKRHASVATHDIYNLRREPPSVDLTTVPRGAVTSSDGPPQLRGEVLLSVGAVRHRSEAFLPVCERVGGPQAATVYIFAPRYREGCARPCFQMLNVFGGGALRWEIRGQ